MRILARPILPWEIGEAGSSAIDELHSELINRSVSTVSQPEKGRDVVEMNA